MMLFTLIPVAFILVGAVTTAFSYYAMCMWFGFGTGYWAMFVTVGAEQFGTNLRSTAATTIPNMVRGTVILMTFGFNQLKAMHFSVLMAAGIIGFIAFAIGIYATLTIKETHGIDLDYLEED